MLKRIIAIAFIFACASAAWMILGATIFSRTYDSDQNLEGRVRWAEKFAAKPGGDANGGKTMNGEFSGKPAPSVSG